METASPRFSVSPSKSIRLSVTFWLVNAGPAYRRLPREFLYSDRSNRAYWISLSHDTLGLSRMRDHRSWRELYRGPRTSKVLGIR